MIGKGSLVARLLSYCKRYKPGNKANKGKGPFCHISLI